MAVTCTEEGRHLTAVITGELDHHRAGSDSLACGEILLHHLRSGANMIPFIRTYDLIQIRTAQPARRR